MTINDVSIEPNHVAPAVTALTAFSNSPTSRSLSDAASVAPQPQSSAKELLVLIEGTSGLPPFAHVASLALDHFDEVMDILGLEGEQRGREFVAYNPKRDDSCLGSFSINSETGAFGDFATDDCAGGDLIALAAYCWGCGNATAARRLVEELAKLDLDHPQVRPPSPLQRKVANVSRTVVAGLVQPIPTHAPELKPEQFVYRGETLEDRYDYRDRDGSLCFSVLRIRTADGNKTFRPLSVSLNAAGKASWRATMPEGQRPLFGLPSLTEATNTTKVFVVEGEKAALALRKMLPESPVLTSVNGSKSASKSDWSPLAGCDVVIWPDNDEPGAKYLQDVRRLIRDNDPATPISVVDVEALLRAVCGLKGWVYEEKAVEFKGWDAANVAALGLESEVLAALIDKAIEPAEQTSEPAVGTDDRDVWPITDVEWESGKLYRKTANAVEVYKPKEEFWAKVCSMLEIVRQLRDAEGTGWSLELSLRSPDGATKTIVLQRAWLTDAQRLKALLLDNGVVIYNWLELHDYIAHAIPSETHTLVRRVGWHGDAYVRSGVIYGATEEPLALDGAAPACTAFGQQGTLENWNLQIGRLCSGNSRLMVAVCAALAGPLLRPLGVENGGFHLVGPSSVGKTTALRVAASVYGPPDKFIRSWRSTSNGLESVAAGHNDCVLLMDEMNQAAPHEVGEVVYMLGNGQGKARMTKLGVGARLLEWKLLFVSTGEIPLQQHVESVGKAVRAGMEVRLLNLPADAGAGRGMFETLHGFEKSQALAEHLRTVTGDVHGVAGDAWLRYLADQMKIGGHEAFAERYSARLSAIEAQFALPGADGQVSRASKRFALLALAGEMAAEAGIGGWAPGEAETAMQRCFEAWVTERGGVRAGEEAQALRQVQRFFEQHGQARFQRIENMPVYGDESVNEVRTIQQRAGYYRPSVDEFYVLPEPFKRQVCEGLDARLVTRVLREKGLLLAEGSCTVRVPGLANPIRAYRISGRIVGYDPEDHVRNPPTVL